MDINEIKALIEKHKDLVLKAERDIRAMPEVGFREFRTDAYMKDAFRRLGYRLTEAEGITGFCTVADTGREGPTVLVLAELDALYCAGHPERDPVTNAAHACGHHAQCAALLGLAAALKEKNALDGLSGRIKLCVVPAEEGIDIEYRMDLIKSGKISFASGKQQFLSRGLFDDVDVAFMVHAGSTDPAAPEKLFSVYKGYNGVIRKKIVIKGRAAHAGGSPHLGINALNAASLVICAVNSLRETFREEDHVRFHPIITKGGDAVNAVPAEVIMQSYVRAASTAALTSANRRINRAVAAAAAANGCTALISDIGGSEPFEQDANLTSVFFDVCEKIGGKECCDDRSGEFETCSTDMGDIAVNFPSLHPYAAGAEGAEHGCDYRIPDPWKLCGNSAILQFGMIRELLEDGGAKAMKIKASFVPVFPSIRDYIAFKKAQTADIEAVRENPDGSVTLV